MNLNGFLDGISKEKYLVYFLLAWAGVLFFWGISGFYFRAIFLEDAYDGVVMFSRLFDIGAGAMLSIVAFKMLIPNFLPNLKRDTLAIYFLLLWAGGFFFDGVADFVWFGLNGFDVDMLGALCSLAAGAVLALFAWNLLQSSKSLSERLQQPITPTI